MKVIVAMSLNRVIGRAGRIPWHLPEDLRFFKRATFGHIVVMGRKTFESLGHPLPGRENVVVTRRGPIEGATTVASPQDVAEPGDGREVFVIGGAQIYEALLPRCSEILLTLVRQEVSGDAFFPSFEADFVPAGVLLETEAFEIRRYMRKR